MIARKYGPQLFSLILSGLMSMLVSGVATFRAIGLTPDFVDMWASTWLVAWIFAFPAVLLVAPLAQRTVKFLVTKN